jgi:hypothetical protein
MGERRNCKRILLFFNLDGWKKKLAKILVFWPTWVKERRNCKSPTLLTYYIWWEEEAAECKLYCK